MNRTLVVIVLVILGLGGLFFALPPDPTVSGDADSTEAPADEPRERIYDVTIEDDAMVPPRSASRRGIM